jgi:hypothetical protein
MQVMSNLPRLKLQNSPRRLRLLMLEMAETREEISREKTSRVEAKEASLEEVADLEVDDSVADHHREYDRELVVTSSSSEYVTLGDSSACSKLRGNRGQVGVVVVISCLLFIDAPHRRKRSQISSMM